MIGSHSVPGTRVMVTKSFTPNRLATPGTAMTWRSNAVVAWSAEEKRADIAKHEAWFGEHGRWVKGGEELGRPSASKTIRRGLVTDGPFVETKELLGGFIVLDTPDETTALAAAQAWPARAWDGNAVELRPVGSSEAEADAQAGAGLPGPA